MWQGCKCYQNDLANNSQGNLSIAQYFLKIKALCSEISPLDPEEPISDARMKLYIIRGLRSLYAPYVTSIQGWAQQPSLEEFKCLLSSQESLAKQMVGVSINEQEENALTARKKNFKGKQERKQDSSSVPSNGDSSNGFKKAFRYFRCGRPGHIKKNCHVKLKESNVAGTKKLDRSQNEEQWESCFVARIDDRVDFRKDWIVDSGCEHHLTGNDSQFSSLHSYEGTDAIITANNTAYPVEKKGTVVINEGEHDSMTLEGIYHVLGVKKNLFSVTNAVYAGSFVLLALMTSCFFETSRC